MRKIGTNLIFIENTLVVVIFSVMVLAIFLQVLNRSIFMITTLTWTEELARYCMIYITMLGAEIGLRDGSQITILGATSWLSKKKQKILDIFANIIVVIFSCTLFMTTIGTIKRQIVSGQSTPSLRIPMYIPYLSITVFALIIAFVQVIRCIHKLKHFK